MILNQAVSMSLASCVLLVTGALTAQVNPVQPDVGTTLSTRSVQPIGSDTRSSATLELEVSLKRLKVSNGTPWTPVSILIGLQEFPMPLPGGGELRVVPLVVLSGFFDRSGEFVYSIRRSYDDQEPVTVLVQAVSMIDAKGYRVSDMKSIRIGRRDDGDPGSDK